MTMSPYVLLISYRVKICLIIIMVVIIIKEAGTNYLCDVIVGRSRNAVYKNNTKI